MHLITQSCLLFIWINTLNVVTAEDCQLADFLSSDRYDSNFDTSGLASSYPPGKQVRVSCHAGFVGFFKIRCLDNGWNYHGSKCEPKSCGHPGDADFAEFSLVKGDDFVFGAEVQYTCQRGYQMVSRISSRRCMAHGWDGFVPVCDAIHCPVIEAGDNVQVFGDREEATYGSVLRFSCKSRDMVLDGKVEIDCDENGRWSDQAPSCIEVKCTPPPRIDNGRVLGITALYDKDQELRFACDRKFKRIHPMPSKCTRVGIRADWIPTPLCVPVTCPLTTVPGTRHEPDARRQFSPDDTVTVTCDSGYSIGSPREDTKVITCRDTGDWESSPVCEEITCFNPRLETGVAWHNDWMGRNRKLGNTISYTCSRGYKATDVRRTATCTRDGWTPKPLCEEIKCTKPDIPNARIDNPQKMEYKDGEKVTYRCLHDRGTPARQGSCDRDGWYGIQPCAEASLCSKPDGESLIDDFQASAWNKRVGEIQSYSCKSGYKKKDGNDHATCTSGGWTPKPLCEAITCNPEVKNGFGFSDGQRIRMFYTCDTDYKRFYKGWWGHTTCKDGKWHEPPRCIGKNKCGELPQIPHAKIVKPQNDDSTDGYTDGPRLSIEFVCENGCKQINNISAITCKNGKWDLNETNTICKPNEKSCGPPPAVKDAVVMCNYQKKYLAETEVTYKCRRGHKMEGLDKMKCKNGDWEQQNINCIAKTCPRPELAAGTIQGLPDNNGSIPVGHTLTFSCARGSKLSTGIPELTCLEDETWDNPIPSCEVVTCPRPPADGGIDIQDLPVDNGPIHVDHTLRFSCSPPKQLIGQPELTCEENGQWNDVFPSCEVTCEVPELPANLHITNEPKPSPVIQGDKLQFRCFGRKFLQGSEEVECLENGKWSNELPICAESGHCGQPPHLEDGDLKRSLKSRYDYGEKVEYVCQNLFILEGRFRTCTNGQWVGNVKCLNATDESGHCGQPPHLEDGDLKRSLKSRYDYGEKVEYVCQNLFILEGRFRTCTNGQWVGNVKCLKPCTVNEEEMNRNNILFYYSGEKKLYPQHNTQLSFRCKWTGQTSNIHLRQRCVDGYGSCIPLPYPIDAPGGSATFDAFV